MNVEIVPCNFLIPEHRTKLVELTSAYLRDEMGGGEDMSAYVKENLASVLATHPTCMVLFAKHRNEFVGITTCFVNISTFKAKPYFNVHDIAVLKEFRGKGVGRKLLEKVIETAKERGYCKVTLEVREDNTNAMKLYTNLGFKETNPNMFFWVKNL